MGTNFYWRHNACPHCGRHEEIHVGKRSAGWSFAFRGYIHDPDDDMVSPFGFSVESRAGWAKVFREGGGELWDGYGSFVVDPLAWLAELTPPDADMLQWENSPTARGPYWDPDDAHEWRDSEGFRFYGREFS